MSCDCSNGWLQCYRRADNSRPVSFTVSAWERVYATNLSRLQRETSKRHMGEAHSVLTTAILIPQRLSCYWGKIVSLRMLAYLRLTTAQQRTIGQNLPSELYSSFPSLTKHALSLLPVSSTSTYVTKRAWWYGGGKMRTCCWLYKPTSVCRWIPFLLVWPG
jgi:hypothetical protein